MKHLEKNFIGVKISLLLFVFFITNINGSCSKKVGRTSWEVWQKSDAEKTFRDRDYKVEEKYINEINKKVSQRDFTFLIFLGDWCQDSKREFPKIYEVFKRSKVPGHLVEVYGVDEKKNDDGGVAKLNNLRKVPTIVIKKQGQEIGRIEEYPLMSWEKNIADVLNGAR